jgi:alpha-beta hydrolase superfamily lysophospholipase
MKVTTMISLFDHPLINQRYFFPRAGRTSSEFLITLPDCTLSCHFTVNDPKAHTILYFHGNGEIVSDYIPDLRDAFLELGVNVFFAEYRGYGGSTGQPKMASMLDDVTAIVAQSKIPASKLIVFGRSIGSIYAIETARRYPNIAGLIIESGISNPLQRIAIRVTPKELGCSEQELHKEARRLFNHKEKLAPFKNPVLVLHAKNDKLVPVDHARENHKWAGSKDKELVIFERGDHNSILFANQIEYFKKIADFIDRL